MDTRTKFHNFSAKLSARLLERQEEIEIMQACLLAKQHCLFVGEPGVAKSLMATHTCDFINGRLFKYLFNENTSPEEFVGPPNIRVIKDDHYYRVVCDHSLVNCDVAFIDEWSRANSAALNMMLSTLNEGIFYNGTLGATPVPLRFAVAASNHFPTGEEAEKLEAFFDRFLCRKIVRPLQNRTSKEKLWYGHLPPVVLEEHEQVNVQQLDEAYQELRNLPFSQEAIDARWKIEEALAKEHIHPGDRRSEQSIGLCQALAWLDGSPLVVPEHLRILAHCLWIDPDKKTRLKCETIVYRHAAPDKQKVSILMKEASEISDNWNPDDNTSSVETHTKLHNILETLKKMESSDPMVQEGRKSTERIMNTIKAQMLKSSDVPR